MRNKISIFVFLMVLFIFVPTVKASTSYAMKDDCAIANKCSYRTEPNEGGTYPSWWKYLDPADKITLVDDLKVKSTNSKCLTDYYYVEHAGVKGYVCGDYIQFNNSGKYYEELRNAGFPESYLLSLNALKEKYPNWKFEAYNTNLDWNTVISNQSNVEYNSNNNSYWSRSYTNSTNKIYYSRQLGSYDASSDSYRQMEAGGWYAANKETVAYYMDPRNFLNYKHIFMFENLKGKKDYQTTGSVLNIFNNTQLTQYADYFIEAAETNQISPTFLAARSKQEVVKQGGVLSDSANGNGIINGTAYYNFYNLGAFTSCKIDGVMVYNPVRCGLQYALNRNWNNPRSAIIEGASEVANQYVNVDQNALYFQKWNVRNNVYGNHNHQYMTNIHAPMSEAEIMYEAYTKANTMNGNLEFIIPIYQNMPETSNLPTSIPSEQPSPEPNPEPNTPTLNDLIQSVSELGYKVKSNYMYINIDNIGLNKRVNELIYEMNVKGLSMTSNRGTDDLFHTGDTITVKTGNIEKQFTIIVKGDVDGNGKVEAFDYIKIKEHIMYKDVNVNNKLTSVYFEAADINNNNDVNADDYINIKNYIMQKKF